MSAYRQLIQSCAAAGRRFYGDLKPYEQNRLVAALMFTYGDDYDFIIDADRESELPRLIARLIETRFAPSAIQAFQNKLEQLYLTGTRDYEPFFAERIDDALADERAHNGGCGDELYLADARERARDMQLTLKGGYL